MLKTLSIEWNHVGQKPLIDFMDANGYYVFGSNNDTSGPDLFFTQKKKLFR
jgi:hypothetical protein